MKERTHTDSLPLCDELQILHRTDHQNPCIRIQREDTSAALEAVCVRQVHIHRYEVRPQLFVELQCLHGICRHPTDLEIRFP